MMKNSITNNKYLRSVAIMCIAFAALIAFMASCVKLNIIKEWVDIPHRDLNFSIGDTYYSVVGSRPHFRIILTPPLTPEQVGAALTRTRGEHGTAFPELMTVECEREDTLVIGARLTTIAHSDNGNALLLFIVPFSKVVVNEIIEVSPEDVYFRYLLSSDRGSFSRITITSFKLTFDLVDIEDYPTPSIFAGSFEMTGIDETGEEFESFDGHFDVDNTSYDPIWTFDSYKGKG